MSNHTIEVICFSVCGIAILGFQAFVLLICSGYFDKREGGG